MNKRVPLAVFVAIVVVMVTATAQLTQVTPMDSSYLEQYRGMSIDQIDRTVWNYVIDRNRDRYPDSNLVHPGNQLLMPYGYQFTVPRGSNMYRAAMVFTDSVVRPYLYPSPVHAQSSTPVLEQPTTIAREQNPWHQSWYWPGNWPWWVWVIVVVAVLAFFGSLLERSEQRKREQERARAFVPDPPNWRTAGHDQVRRVAEEAARQAFGSGISIVGQIETGYITGEQVMFNRDGSTSTERFDNEPGYRARVRFQDGTERTVVCRWACFNPLYSVTGAEFTGTFRPEGAKVAEEIPAITATQSDALQQSIKGSESTLTATDLPATDESSSSPEPEITTPEPPTATPTDGEITVEKLVISPERWTIERFVGTPGQLREIFRDLQKVAPLVSGKAQPATGNGKKEPKAPKAKAPAADTKPAGKTEVPVNEEAEVVNIAE